MGEIADHHVNNFSSGRWGMPAAPRKKIEFNNPSKDEISRKNFHIVEVIGGNTNRPLKQKLIVCDKDDVFYHVWKTDGVSGIYKSCCKVLEANLCLSVALARLNRKPYKHADI
ncbi:hypothetical protein [Comamonas thiooxydans]|uniref:hypothetical protein n=1 Tax=Comamonas thiooxydans TaxID=363952 RepID=UPI001186FBCF|nr:hypothetical protein [Comamonas thiooxydans]